MAKHRRPTPYRHAATAFLAVAAAFAALFLTLAPAAQAAQPVPTAGNYGQTCTNMGGAVTPERAWAQRVVGCGTELDDATVARLIDLRQLTCEGLRADVPPARLVDGLATALGNRRDAVTLFTAVAVYCYGG